MALFYIFTYNMNLMKGEALLFMLASWGIIYGLAVFCFTMLMNNPPPEGEENLKNNGSDTGFGDEEIT